MFIIEDEIHAEPGEGKFKTFKQAIGKLIELSKMPWN